MITETQRQERRRFIGSSDIAALFTDNEGKSLDPFKTPYDVWASKVFDFEETKDARPLSIGKRYESALIQYVADETGQAVVSDPDRLRFICKDCDYFAANLDGFIENGIPIIVEVKTTSMSEEWGEPGTDQVPNRVILQVHHQMLCTGWDTAYVAVLLGKWSLTEQLYKIPRNQTIINGILKRGREFWENHVLTKTPPPDCEPGNISILKRIIRVPETFAECSDTSIITVWDDTVCFHVL